MGGAGFWADDEGAVAPAGGREELDLGEEVDFDFEGSVLRVVCGRCAGDEEVGARVACCFEGVGDGVFEG